MFFKGRISGLIKPYTPQTLHLPSIRPYIPLIGDHILLFEGTWRVLAGGGQRQRREKDPQGRQA